jgi:hypothetical protein
MPFIPKNAEWYLAEIVIEFQVETDDRNIVHVNFMLIEASSPEEAYNKALRLGQISNGEHINDEGNRVKVAFRGLRNLHVIYEPLEDGAEILYEEHQGISESNLGKLVRPKEMLNVFRSDLNEGRAPATDDPAHPQRSSTTGADKPLNSGETGTEKTFPRSVQCHGVRPVTDSNKPTIRGRIEQALAPMLGKPLCLTKTSGNLRGFHFGTITRTERALAGEYVLHVSCPWRIEGGSHVITGSGDYYLRADDNDDPSWEYGMPWGTVQQQALRKLFGAVDGETGVIINSDPEFMLVEAFDVDDFGSVTLKLSGGHTLKIFTCSSRGEEWRLLPPADSPHFVVEGGCGYLV